MTMMPPPPSQPPVAPQRQGAYATWGARLAAYLIDGLLSSAVAFVGIIPFFMFAAAIETDPATGASGDPGGLGIVMLLLSLALFAASIAFTFWNLGWRQGTTGQSIGKGVMDISVIKTNGTFMGGGLGIGRYLVHAIVGGACFLDYLWPLWDERNQTWTDKILDTIVVRA